MILFAICASGHFSTGSLAQAPAGFLQTTHAQTLSGAKIQLPVPGHTTLLLIGFSKKSGSAVGVGWKQAQPICAANSVVACYQVAVLQEEPTFMRGLIVHGIRSGKSSAAQATFVTVFENEAAWKSSLHFNDGSAAYAVLLGPDGKILRKTSGTVATLHLEPLLLLLQQKNQK